MAFLDSFAAGMLCAAAICPAFAQIVATPEGKAPSDAVVLFDGKDLSQWTARDGSPARSTAADGEIRIKTGDGNLYSKAKFRDAQLHIEFNVPSMPDQKDQARGNSGVFLHGKYEIQILDSWNNPTYADGVNAALYGQAPPLVNASRPPGEWQTFDIVFHAPRCESATLVKHGRVTLFHNGVLVQDNVEIQRTSHGCIQSKLGEPGPLVLQDHNYPNAPMTVMRFRNIWLRPLEEK